MHAVEPPIADRHVDALGIEVAQVEAGVDARVDSRVLAREARKPGISHSEATPGVVVSVSTCRSPGARSCATVLRERSKASRHASCNALPSSVSASPRCRRQTAPRRGGRPTRRADLPADRRLRDEAFPGGARENSLSRRLESDRPLWRRQPSGRFACAEGMRRVRKDRLSGESTRGMIGPIDAGVNQQSIPVMHDYPA
ncbi:MAG: hypothetical protein U1F17_14880 [Burkholderiaceae bacterium]